MNWKSDDQSDSDNEMFQMSSSRIQEDTTRVRLLSISEDEDSQETSARDAGVPQLHFRQRNEGFTKAQEEKKTKCAVISILVVGVTLIVIINIGLGIKFKSMHQAPEKPTLPFVCPVEDKPEVKRCNRSFPWQSYHLPDYVHPQEYHLFLHPNLTLGNYSGIVDIVITVSRSTDVVIVHSHALDINRIKVFRGVFIRWGKVHEDHVVYQSNDHAICPELNFIAIPLPEKLQVGEQYTVHIEFVGSLTMSLRGFYLSKYKTKTGENRTLAATQFESTDARSAFPCFDEPSFKANFSVSIVTDEDHSAISNMPVERTSDYHSGLTIVDFQPTVPMSTYLVAFIVSDFKNITRTIPLKNGPVAVSVYAPEEKLGSADFALDFACKSLHFYEKVFKLPYPLPKLDLAAVPDFEAGAMENWGLVNYRETLILWDNETSSTTDKELVALVIAHELAHQWFGNLVTMKWWNDLWLNEGFASFVEFLGVDHIYPEWGLVKDFFSEHVMRAMHTDESKYTHPITVPVESDVQIEEVFDDISYSKGACIIAMMIDYLGEESFFNGVTDYLKKFAYHNSVNRDLVRAVAARANSNDQKNNVMRMLDSWTTEPGYPIVNVSLHGNEVTASQMRHLLSVESDLDPRCVKPRKDPVWQIPLSFRTDSSDEIKWKFVENKTFKFSIEGDLEWVIFNVNRGGYYLVNYDKNLLSALDKQLQKDHTVISPTDRSGILFNAAKSAKAGFLSYDVLFNLLLYAKKETEYLPIQTTSDILLDMVSHLKMQFDTESYKSIKRFTVKLLEHVYEKYGWPEGSGKDTEKSLTRPQIKLRRLAVNILCAFDHKDCTQRALRDFRSWLANGSSIRSDFKTAVHSAGIRTGRSDYWDFMWKKYSTDLTIDALEKKKLLRALCLTTEEKKVSFLLDEALKGENIRFQDTRSVLVYLARTRIGSLMAWKFIKSKWGRLTQIYPMGSFATQQLLSIFNTFTDESDIAGAETFINDSNMTEIRFVQRALDQAKLNIRWIKTHQPQVVKWLRENIDKV